MTRYFQLIVIMVIVSMIGTNNANAQLTLEKVYTDSSGIYPVVLTNGGLKYCSFQLKSSGAGTGITPTIAGLNITLYNQDQSIYKNVSLSIPLTGSTYYGAFPGLNFFRTSKNDVNLGYENSNAFKATNSIYVSDNLFNSDNKIEFAFSISQKYYNGSFYLYNEDGLLLQKVDSSYLRGASSYNGVTRIFLGSTKKQDGFNFDGIGGTTYSNPTRVYTLSGSVPTNVSNNRISSESTNSITNAYPVPTAGELHIDYNLPDNVQTAELIVYNDSGVKVKSYIVDHTFNYIKLDNSEFSAGQYTYLLYSDGKTIGDRKILVIK